MNPPSPRTLPERKSDTLAKLSAHEVDVWVATASGPSGTASAPAGESYLVPLTMAWLRERIVLATDGRSRTAVNIASTGRARIGLGPTRDVVMIDADLQDTFPVLAAPDWVADGYARSAGWDPRTAGGTQTYLVLRPHRIQAWREADEIPGRTLMRNALWLD